MALFGWQGLNFEHPDDWAPVVLSGDRKQGYARLAGPSRIGCQVRWQKAAQPKSMIPMLQSYLARLQKDAKRARTKFDSDWKEERGALSYRWTAADQGRGALFFDDASGRVIFLEAFGGKKDSLLPSLRELRNSFGIESQEGRELWSLYGLTLHLPAEMKVVGKKLESGRTLLELTRRGLTLTAQRWAFGEQLIAMHGFEPWAAAVLKVTKTEIESAGMGLRHQKVGLPFGKKTSLVRFQPEANQIVIVSARHRKPEWEPKWDWLD